MHAGGKSRRAIRLLASIGTLAVSLTGCSTPPGASPLQTEVKELGAPVTQHAIRAAGTQTVTFDEGTNMAITRDPSSGQFVASIQGTLFAIPAEGGKATPLTDYYQDAREPQFSPDGTGVVYYGYAAGNWDIYALRTNDSSVRQLTSGAFDDREPVFAPDQRSIVFSSDRSGNYDLWQLSLQTGELSQLTYAPQDEYSPGFIRNGTALIYVRHLQRDETEIRTLELNSNTPGSKNKTPDASSQSVLRESGVISGLSVAPDSQSIAYQLSRRDRLGQTHTELKVSDLQGGSTTLSSPGMDIFPFRAAWPDTQTIIASANGKIQRFSVPASQRSSQRKKNPPTTIPFTASFTLNRDGYSRRPRDYSATSKQVLGVVAPTLSYAGDLVAFTALGDLWQWNFATDELKQLTDDRFAEATPSFSPDGKYLAYVSDREGSQQLWLHNLVDGTQRVLDKNLSGVSFPSWSPDGNHIAYFGELPGNPLGGQLMLADLELGTSKTLGAPTSPQPLSWSKDSKHLAAAALAPYAKRYREGVYELLVFSTQGQEVARVNTQPHLSPFDIRLTPDGRGVGYVQGGQLYYQPIDAAFKKVGEPRLVSSALADMPAWSGNGEIVLALSGNRVRRFNVASGKEIESRVVPLDYSRKLATDRWTLRSSRLFNGVDSTYQENIDIVINGNRIESMQPRSAASPEPIVDVSAHSVMPGLFEMHAHMGNLSEPQGRTWLAYGITTVRDPGSNPYLAKERQETWDSGRRAGPRTHVTGYLTDGNRVFYPIAESLNEHTLSAALERTKALQLDFIKTYVRLSDSQQRKVVEFAHNLGIPTSSHELFPAAAHGMDHVEHIGGTSRRGYQPKVTSLGYSYADVVELLAGSKMGITATSVLPAWAVIFQEDKDLFQTPAFNHFYGPEALKGYAGFARRFGDGAKTYHTASSKLLRELVERDALLVTGTDSPFVPYGTGLHAELRLFERAGLKPWQVLRAATSKAAIAAGVEGELGTLAPGMLADMVVVAGDPLAQIKDADNVLLTVKGGQRFSIEDLLAD